MIKIIEIFERVERFRIIVFVLDYVGIFDAENGEFIFLIVFAASAAVFGYFIRDVEIEPLFIRKNLKTTLIVSQAADSYKRLFVKKHIQCDYFSANFLEMSRRICV